MSIHVMYFGMLAEITGQASEQWMIEENLTVGKFRQKVEDKYPLLRDKKFKIAVNKQIADDFITVPHQAELALLPPFAGG
jgi:molybdopterin synthase sulfur carrier subunit